MSGKFDYVHLVDDQTLINELTAAGILSVVHPQNRVLGWIKGATFRRISYYWEVTEAFLPLEKARQVYAVSQEKNLGVRVNGHIDDVRPDDWALLARYATPQHFRAHEILSMGRKAFDERGKQRRMEAKQALAEGRISELMIPLYHIDTLEGLTYLASVLKNL